MKPTLPAEEHVVYPPQARSVAEALARVLEFFPEDPECWKRMAEELGDLMKRCGEDELSVIDI